MMLYGKEIVPVTVSIQYKNWLPMSHGVSTNIHAGSFAVY
jgi:hypothetical protein